MKFSKNFVRTPSGEDFRELPKSRFHGDAIDLAFRLERIIPICILIWNCPVL